MASLQSQIEQARSAGYSEEEIKAYLKNSPEFKQANESGYSPNEIWQHLGFEPDPEQAFTSPIELPGGAQVPGQVARYPLLAASGALKGAEQTIGLPGTIRDFLVSKFPQQMAGVETALSGSPLSFLNVMSSGAEITGASQQLGLTDRPDLIPQNSTERFVSGAGEGAGSALPLLPLAGVGALVSGAAGGLGATLGGELTHGNPYAELAGGVLGGMVSPTAITKVLSGKGVDALLESAKDELSEAKAGRIEGIAAAQEAAQAKAAAIAARNGGANDFSAAGTAFQQSARDWLAGLPQREAQAWAPLDQLIGNESSSSLTPVLQSIEQMRGLGGANTAAAGKAVSLLPSSMREAAAKAAIEGDDPLATWNEWRQLHLNSSDALRNAGLANDIAGSHGTDIHNAIIGQMGEIADQHGAFPQFAAALAQSEHATDLATNVLPKAILHYRPSAGDPDPTKLVQGIAAGLRTSPEQFARLSEIDPDAARKIAGAILNPQEDPALAGHSGLINWGKLGEESKAALVPDPADRAELEAAYSQFKNAPQEQAAKISKLQAQVDALKGAAGTAPAKEGNELLRVIAFENLASPVAHALGLGPMAEAGMMGARAAIPTIKRLTYLAKRSPSSVVAGGLAGSAAAQNPLMPE